MTPEEIAQRYRIAPGTKPDLAARDAAEDALFDGGRKAGEEALEPISNRIENLQELLYADGKQRILVVLQGMDTSGKGGTISKVFEGVNPAGVKVASFKKPTAEELAHDYLWRVHARVPGNGELVIFDRSHYEDVLVVRVHSLVPESTWRPRYEQICNFEGMLVDSGTTILKFFLHIDRAEQKERLQARIDDPNKRWKFRTGDLDERALWDDYMRAYEEAIERTSTEEAAWYVVPANRKWYRNLVVGTVIAHTLEGLGMAWPQPAEDLSSVIIP